MTFRDGYGASLDRNGACFDPEASVVVTITDTCPCYYPGNMYSNKRWCCGDMYHLVSLLGGARGLGICACAIVPAASLHRS
jgi:hypothetical protein